MPSPDRIVKSISEWTKTLEDFWADQNLGEELQTALFHYLADLGVFEEVDADNWTLVGSSNLEVPSSKTLEKVVQEKVNTDAGFALRHFVQGAEGSDSPHMEPRPSTKPGGRSIFSRSKELPRGSSDPSNLQIVKKVGRQMESYIELEKAFMEKLPGRYTTRNDARKIYNFALSKTKHKANPQAWEQLSRRRHR